jgi:transposase InsO family protein
VDQHWFCHYPQPRAAIFDNGSEFSSEFFELLQSYGVAAKPTTIKNPQANAFVERIHQVMGNSIHSMELSKRHFDDTSVNAILQSVAYVLFLGSRRGRKRQEVGTELKEVKVGYEI